jgi:hypothetical protein
MRAANITPSWKLPYFEVPADAAARQALDLATFVVPEWRDRKRWRSDQPTGTATKSQQIATTVAAMSNSARPPKWGRYNLY